MATKALDSWLASKDWKWRIDKLPITASSPTAQTVPNSRGADTADCGEGKVVPAVVLQRGICLVESAFGKRLP